MNYYIEDYEYEKHDLLIEKGEKDLQSGVWVDAPELIFCQDNVIKVGYSISIITEESIASESENIITFYNDLILKAKDGHKLSVEEIGIFILLLMNETVVEATAYLSGNYELTDVSSTTPEEVIQFIMERMDAQN